MIVSTCRHCTLRTEAVGVGKLGHPAHPTKGGYQSNLSYSYSLELNYTNVGLQGNTEPNYFDSVETHRFKNIDGKKYKYRNDHKKLQHNTTIVYMATSKMYIV